MKTLFLKSTEEEINIINNNNIKKHIKTNYVCCKNKVCIKPWGHEFQIFESNKIGIWFLKIFKGNQTSLHLHYKKDTLVVVISGIAKLNLINNEVLSLGPMESVFIPKNKFHGLSAFSDEVYLLELEIFDNDVTFSNKNDLLRIEDNYNRDRTGYESSISLSDELDKYDYFYLDNNISKNIYGTKIEVTNFDTNKLNNNYNILLSGELSANGQYIREGSIVNNIVKDDYIYSKDAIILSISNDYAHEDSKLIYSLEHLDTIIKKLTNENKKIVLTSGCYDIIHVGHIHNLREAKKQGDILIACLSSDEQIKKLKGEARPINNYKDRIDLFKTISYVDYIVLYNEENIEKEETLGKIMKHVNPYCWVKGNDYTIDKIVEKHPYLKKIVLIDNIPDKSTTNILHIIKK